MEAGDTAGGPSTAGLVWKECIYVNVHVFRSRKPPAPLRPMLTRVMGGGGVRIGRLSPSPTEFEQQIPAHGPCRVPESQHLVF